MFGARFDESEAAGKLLVVAGYLARARQWGQFHREWCEALAPEGIDPRYVPFHMAEFESRKVPYMRDKSPFLKIVSGWSDEQAERVLSRLTTIINSRAAVGVVIALALPDWAYVNRNNTNPITPYMFCAIRCFAQVREWAHDQQEYERIVYVFEDGSGKKPQQQVAKSVAEFHDEDKVREHFRIGGFAYGKKRDYVELQAADMAAWEARKYCLSPAFQARTKEGLRTSLQTLLHGLRHYTEYWDYAELERFGKELKRRRVAGEEWWR